MAVGLNTVPGPLTIPVSVFAGEPESHTTFGTPTVPTTTGGPTLIGPTVTSPWFGIWPFAVFCPVPPS